MERRKFLIGMGSIAAGGAAAIGSGAFSQSTAQRQIELTIAPDSTDRAYLNLSPTGSNPYAEYENNVFKLSFGENGYGDALPSRANTLFEDVFVIENQGTNTVDALLPSFSNVSISGVQEPAAASTQFLVDSNRAPVSDPEGARWLGTTLQQPSVDKVDISWPTGISPAQKPSNPIPQDETLNDDAATGSRVNTSYTGLRYPGGPARLGPGESVVVDVRFTVSNTRSGVDDRSAGALYRAVETPSSDSDWEF